MEVIHFTKELGVSDLIIDNAQSKTLVKETCNLEGVFFLGCRGVIRK